MGRLSSCGVCLHCNRFFGNFRQFASLRFSIERIGIACELEEEAL